MNLSAITDQYAGNADLIPGSADTADRRKAALSRFSELGLPSRSIESWRYTDLSAIAGRPLRYIAGQPDNQTIAAARKALSSIELSADAPVCTFVDGVLAEELSTFRNSGSVSVSTLPEATADLITASPETALESLNSAFASAGALIHFTETEQSLVQLVFLSSGDNLAQQLKLKIQCGRHSNAVIHQYFAALPGEGEAWLNLVTEIEQDAESRLALFRLQQQAAGHVLTSLTRASLAEAATFDAMNVELGGQTVRNEYTISLNGERASANVAGLALTDNKQHVDTRIDVDHRAANTNSRQDYRAMAADSSRCVFNGKVTVQKDAQHIEARQRNDNLLLSEHAEIDTKPELEIYADQVVCSHGATIGELDENHLFYLRSRGIDADSARRILTTAFADVILARIDDETLHSMVRDAVIARLPE